MTLPTSKTERYSFHQADFDQMVQNRLTQKGPHAPLEVLVLSGGGANGAWGAGFLGGWAEDAGSRPRFDVVTGVSTGGLLATGAFLGNDAILQQSFTTITDADIKGDRFFLFIPFSDSVYTSAPLKKTIAKFISNAMIDQVAVEADKNRRLYVASTDLDAGLLHIWDLTAIAKAKDYEFYRTVLLASASAPMIFPPVNIEGALNADGGVKANLFFRNELLPKIARGHRHARQNMVADGTESAAAAASAPKPTIYVIVNGALDSTNSPVKDCLIPLAERAVNCLMDSNNVGCLYETDYWADKLKYDFRLCFIPSTVTPCESFTFDQPKMLALYNAGKTWGQKLGSQSKWMVIPSVDEGATVKQ
jgi:Patatin-like phospholipase